MKSEKLSFLILQTVLKLSDLVLIRTLSVDLRNGTTTMERNDSVHFLVRFSEIRVQVAVQHVQQMHVQQCS